MEICKFQFIQVWKRDSLRSISEGARGLIHAQEEFQLINDFERKILVKNRTFFESVWFDIYICVCLLDIY